MNFKDIKNNELTFGPDMFFVASIMPTLCKTYGLKNCSYENNFDMHLIKVKIIFTQDNFQYEPRFFDTLIIIFDTDTLTINQYYFENIQYCKYDACYINEIIKIFKLFTKHGFVIPCNISHCAICDIKSKKDFEILKNNPDYIFVCLDNYEYFENADMSHSENIRFLVSNRFLRSKCLKECLADGATIMSIIQNSINYTTQLYLTFDNVEEHKIYMYKR